MLPTLACWNLVLRWELTCLRASKERKAIYREIDEAELMVNAEDKHIKELTMSVVGKARK